MVSTIPELGQRKAASHDEWLAARKGLQKKSNLRACATS